MGKEDYTVLYDYGRGTIQIVGTTPSDEDGYKILLNGETLEYLHESEVDIWANAFERLVEDPYGEKKQAARQGIVDVLGAVCAKAEYDRACIIQQVAELADVFAYEIVGDEEEILAQEVTPDIPHF